MPRRSKVIVLLTLPIAAFLWLVGWCLYCVGSRKMKIAPPLNVVKKEDLTFVVIPIEKTLQNR